MEIKVPELAESITEGTIIKWLKQPGEFVDKGEYVVELETDKVNVEITSEVSGVIEEHSKEEGDTVSVGETLAIVKEGKNEDQNSTNDDTSSTEDREHTKDNKDSKHKEGEKDKRKDPIASPAARKLAREKGINLEEVPAKDPLGRLRKSDIELYDKSSSEEKKQPYQENPSVVKENKENIERIPMSRRRQTIAKRLVEAQQSAAMLTTFNEVDMTAVMEMRNRHKEEFQEEYGIKLGFMSFFTKAIIAALKKFPLLNAEIEGTDIIKKNFFDIGVAVSTDEGLVVPVVRNADQRDFGELEKEIARLAEAARNQSLKIQDLQGGTFTITNGGIFGSLLSTPILNTPQVGILGMHKIQWRPVAVDKEQMENRPMMYIALSYDHRIIDGKEAVSFLVKVKELLETPEKLMLQS
ncbi:2-oxoglutarate dehydrogenase complex dihydrolipoyllysine-residue succinyltransferase [Alkalihalobacillus sp. MEB203]|uniref:Dihydrolipoyllysine-residue succinyltransferase component of 2-oxoglutarate dehydrogenase complex n=1 Tax=Alkalihalobacterium chitinilyticum TaxID=2980103 RepID=A0ABT5VBQ4_9BACI|nr:2-oxoglutarate dehydrogenase complex dihydrolipoyllysine-residue succinyltransferase [Alkalihalobacterium chitinilyticum]MDE5412772.1 2-oxoglutarate dehydrogenase complex dihydrolipoyllysine-residue succinyltransferase [Alkalihalobacterium chitinilyticum]